MKKLLHISLLLVVLTFIPRSVLAQSTNTTCVLTQVGIPGTSPTLPPECNDRGNNEGPPGGITPPDYPSDLANAIKTRFGLTVRGFDQQHLRWIWEQLWAASNTKFADLTNVAIIEAKNSGYSIQVGCGDPSIKLRQYPGEASFKFLLTHELGHFIRWCNPRHEIKFNDHINAYSAEGPISWYGRYASACFGGGNERNYSEDYADTIAYYLNPSAGLNSLSSCVQENPSLPAGDRTPPNPYFQLVPRKELHYNVVRQIL